MPIKRLPGTDTYIPRTVTSAAWNDWLNISVLCIQIMNWQRLLGRRQIEGWSLSMANVWPEAGGSSLGNGVQGALHRKMGVWVWIQDFGHLSLLVNRAGWGMTKGHWWMLLCFFFSGSHSWADIKNQIWKTWKFSSEMSLLEIREITFRNKTGRVTDFLFVVFLKKKEKMCCYF